MNSRPLKFRVWDKNHKYMHYPSGDGLMLNTNEMGYNELIQEFEDEEYNISDDIIIQQFTGLLDKNNKEIYEGDIIKWENTVRGYPAPSKDAEPFKPEQVIWDDMKGKFEFFRSRNDFSWYCAVGEIIGNIFENPELLK